MSQIKIFTQAEKNLAQNYYQKLIAHFEDYPYAIAHNELTDNSAGNKLWEVALYRPIDNGQDCQSIRAEIASLLGLCASQIHYEIMPEQDWVSYSLKALHPIQTQRFFIYGEHDKDQLVADKIPIKIEAACAFGTGHHATTFGCLSMIEDIFSKAYGQNTSPKSPILDLGTGSGILAIAMAKLALLHQQKLDILASDNDIVAVKIAKENSEINNTSSSITPLLADGLDHELIKAKAPFRLVTANILAEPLIALADSLKQYLQPKADVILSGILTSQEDKVLKHYQKAGFELKNRLEIKEWSTLHLQLMC